MTEEIPGDTAKGYGHQFKSTIKQNQWST